MLKIELDAKGNVIERGAVTGEILTEGFVMRSSKGDPCQNFFFQTAEEAEEHKKSNPKLFLND